MGAFRLHPAEIWRPQPESTFTPIALHLALIGLAVLCVLFRFTYRRVSTKLAEMLHNEMPDRIRC